MSYRCEECEANCNEDWCLSCDKKTKINHTCEIESGRLKDLEYGDNGWTSTVYFNFCDECGFIDI